MCSVECIVTVNSVQYIQLAQGTVCARSVGDNIGDQDFYIMLNNDDHLHSHDSCVHRTIKR